MNSFLLRGLRVVIRADSDPARQVLFANLKDSHPRVQLAYWVHERLGGTWASSLLVSLYGLAAFLSIESPRNRQARVLTVARHANAKRQVARVVSWVGPADCDRVRARALAMCGWAGLRGVAVLTTRGRLVRALRIVRAVDRRYGFLVSCRVAAAIAWYARGKAILAAHAPGAVLVSSDSHPEEVGFVGAARALRIPQVFVAHAYPTPISPPLDFSLSILEGEAAVRARREKGPIRGAVLLAGIEGESAPLDPHRLERSNPVIGIFPPKAVCWPTLAAIIADCREHLRARQFLIRWHPSTLETPHLARAVPDLAGIVETPRDAALPDVARQCDWVIADENSNVHLPVLKLGIPTVSVRRLGLFPDGRVDQYGFVAGGVVSPPVQSIRDVRADALIAFFSDCWRSRFEQYDASYLRPPAAIGDEVRHAIWGLVGPSSGT